MTNQFMFCTEQCVFIYDQYLTQSASQVRRLFETRFPGVKIPSRSAVYNLYNKFKKTGNAEPKKQHKARRVISVTKLTTSIEENYSELWESLYNGVKNVWRTMMNSSSTTVNKVDKYDNL